MIVKQVHVALPQLQTVRWPLKKTMQVPKGHVAQTKEQITHDSLQVISHSTDNFASSSLDLWNSLAGSQM